MKTPLFTLGLAGTLLLSAGLILAFANEVNSTTRDDFNWNEKGPFEFIAFLIRQDESGVKRIQIDDAPEGWLQKEHLELLVLLLDSNEPCASVGSMRSSFVDRDGKDQKSSTVGHEAAYLIESYRHGLYPKFAVNTSADLELDKAQIKQWWDNEQDDQTK